MKRGNRRNEEIKTHTKSVPLRSAAVVSRVARTKDSCERSDPRLDPILGNRHTPAAPWESVFGGECSGSREQPRVSSGSPADAPHSAMVGLDGRATRLAHFILGMGSLVGSFARFFDDLHSSLLANVRRWAASSRSVPSGWLSLCSRRRLFGGRTDGYDLT